MKIDSLKAFVQLREKLQREKSALEARLQRINEALAEPVAVGAAVAPTGPGRRRGRNAISLPKAILQVTARKPMTKEEILDAVLALGYRFRTKRPLESIKPILYGRKPKFLRKDGKFSLASGALKVGAPLAGRKRPKRRRKISAAGRARLKALAKARWAKVKASGRTRL